MPGVAARAVAAGGGRVTPPTPTATWSTTGVFIISNYDPSLTYTITQNTGTAIRSGNQLTLSNADEQAYVTATLPKGVAPSPAATIERKAYTNSYVAVGSHSGSCDATYTYWDGFSWNIGHYSYPCTITDYGWVRDSTPSGYVDSGTEWWKAV